LGGALRFFRAWLSNPRLVGAILPSSAALGKAITAEITVVSAPVIELGPGTGVFTRAMLGRGVPEHKMALCELEPNFAQRLRLRFPAAQVVCADAARLRAVELFGGERAGAVLSGLPLLNMPADKVAEIVDGAFRHLRPGAAFYQFTYGRHCPVPRVILEQLGLKAVRTRRVIANLPPASVYRISRRQTQRTTTRSALLPRRDTARGTSLRMRGLAEVGMDKK